MKTRIATVSAASLLSIATAMWVTETSTSAPRAADASSPARLVSMTSGPLTNPIPGGVFAGASSTPITPGSGYHFQLLNGQKNGLTDQEVAVTKGSETIGYIESPNLITAKEKIVTAHWKLKDNKLTLDATTIPSGAGYLTSYLQYHQADNTQSAGMSTINYGFVSVPGGYQYNPKRGSLHDYCTKSPDSWRSADFKGPCAIHDMCYQQANTLSGLSKVWAKQKCNNQLLSNMDSNCDYAYSWYNPLRGACHGIARAYWGVVSVVNP